MGRAPPSAENAGPDITAFQVLTEVAIIDQLAGSLIRRALPAGLSVAQYSVLNHFVRLGGEAAPVDLASAFQVTKGAMTNTLRRLESQGYVVVRADPNDGRRKLVSLTLAGRAIQAESLERVGPALRRLRIDFHATELQVVLPFLIKLRTWLDRNR